MVLKGEGMTNQFSAKHKIPHWRQSQDISQPLVPQLLLPSSAPADLNCIKKDSCYRTLAQDIFSVTILTYKERQPMRKAI